MDFPELFTRDKSGKLRYWSIHVSDQAVITKSHGVVGGKDISTDTVVDYGKNIGKSNETTPFEQACLIAKSLWKKQTEAGYSEDQDNVETKVLPMLANQWTDKHGHISEPFYVQPKLDGVRCLIGCTSSGTAMMTRTGKPITVFDHILDDIGNVLNQGEVIDGELYAEGLCFEEITGLCRTEKAVPAHLKIHFYCFDFFSLDNLAEPFEKRFRKLETLFKSFGQQHVHLVETTRVLSKKTVSRWHDTFVEKGYEGIMIRDANGTYGLNERSNHLLKLKNFQTDEYRVVGAEEATGKDAGTVVWICETSDGKKFNVRPKGSHKQRTTWFEFRDVFTDGTKKLTVQYQNLQESGIPRFPVGLAIRDYE
jgi:DNA ligase-1